MNNLKSAIIELLNPEVILDDYDEVKDELYIKENDPNSKIRKLSIKGLKGKFVAFTLDLKKFPQLSLYLRNDTPNINKSCDFILITKTKKLFIIIADIKSGNFKKKDIEYQLCNSYFFVKFLLDMLAFHCDIDLPSDNLIIKKLIITDRIRKPTAFKKNEHTQYIISGQLTGSILNIHIGNILKGRTIGCT